MKINIFEKTRNKDKEIKIKDGTVFITVTEGEAIALIQSLTNQICNKSPNVNRKESYSEDGIYFSMAVDDFKEYPRDTRIREFNELNRIRDNARKICDTCKKVHNKKTCPNPYCDLIRYEI